MNSCGTKSLMEQFIQPIVWLEIHKHWNNFSKNDEGLRLNKVSYLALRSGRNKKGRQLSLKLLYQSEGRNGVESNPRPLTNTARFPVVESDAIESQRRKLHHDLISTEYSSTVKGRNVRNGRASEQTMTPQPQTYFLVRNKILFNKLAFLLPKNNSVQWCYSLQGWSGKYHYSNAVDHVGPQIWKNVEGENTKRRIKLIFK